MLSEPELIEVWQACLDDDCGRIIRLLILTAQRKTEIGDLIWTEIDFDKREIELPRRVASHLVSCFESDAIQE